MRMSFLRYCLSLCATVLLAGCGSMNVTSEGGDSSLMLRGNDPLSYFAGAPVAGQPGITAMHEGVTYRFANEENRKSFAANPARYAPQYGGWCANGMVYAIPLGGGENWKVIDGRLYMFGGRLSQVYFEMDLQRNIKLADGYWESEVKGSSWRLQSWKRVWFSKVPHYKTNAELSADYERRFGRKP